MAIFLIYTTGYRYEAPSLNSGLDSHRTVASTLWRAGKQVYERGLQVDDNGNLRCCGIRNTEQQ